MYFLIIGQKIRRDLGEIYVALTINILLLNSPVELGGNLRWNK